jgi:hypothetical protein
VLLHGIKSSDVIQASTMIETLQLFLDWVSLGGRIKEVVLIAHNSSFDKSRLETMMASLLLHYDITRFRPPSSLSPSSPYFSPLCS